MRFNGRILILGVNFFSGISKTEFACFSLKKKLFINFDLACKEFSDSSIIAITFFMFSQGNAASH